MGYSPSQHLNCSWHNHPSGAWYSWRSLRPSVKFFFFLLNQFSVFSFALVFPLGKSVHSSKATPWVFTSMHIPSSEAHSQTQDLSPCSLYDEFSLFLDIGSFLISSDEMGKKTHKTQTSYFLLAVKVLMLPLLPYPQDLMTSNWFRAHQRLHNQMHWPFNLVPPSEDLLLSWWPGLYILPALLLSSPLRFLHLFLFLIIPHTPKQFLIPCSHPCAISPTAMTSASTCT